MTHAQQLLLDLPLKPNYAKEDFVESPCNWEATQWIQRWPDWPMKMIAIYGEPGCGKTHLAHIWQEKAGARFINSRDILQMAPHDVLEEARAIVLDDADTLFPKEEYHDTAASQEEREDWMFHFYNLMKERGADLLLCSREAPTHWAVKLPDLRSRLATILSVAINPPDEAALQAVLFKLCSQYGMTLSQEVGDYILRRVERSFDGIRSLVATLDHKTLALHRQLTLGLVREVLNGI